MQSKEDLQKEFTADCVRLGSLVYRNEVLAREITANEQEIEKLQRSMRKLNQQAEDMDKVTQIREIAKESNEQIPDEPA